MCGGLVTATCERQSDVFRYQAGRLIGYLLLAFFSAFLGSTLEFNFYSPYFSLIPTLSISFLFIFWGFQNYKGKKAEVPLPKIWNKIYKFLWNRFVQRNPEFSKAFFIGLLSIFLPCGLLFGIVLGVAALHNPGSALLSMFFFWFGTLPGMLTAPGVVKGLLRPVKAKLPKTYALSLMTIGILTITFRMITFYKTQPESKISHSEEKKIQRCH
jgi:hypothetical protein